MTGPTYVKDTIYGAHIMHRGYTIVHSFINGQYYIKSARTWYFKTFEQAVHAIDMEAMVLKANVFDIERERAGGTH